MLDLFNLPVPRNADVQIFTATTAADQAVMYSTPRSKRMLFIYAVSAGAGGGGGFTGTAGTARGGGGGGGSGAIQTVLIPISFIPNQLWVAVGRGGAGGAAGVAGSAPSASTYVSISNNIVGADLVIRAMNANATGGGAGTISAGGAGGAAATVGIIGNSPLCGIGLYNFLAGQAGTAGGLHTGGNGTTSAFPATGINVMGGTGGGGTTSANFFGGGINAIAGSFISEQRSDNGSVTDHGPGGSNNFSNLFFNFPGYGGRSFNTGVGGAGGNASYGSGGGGGGGGTTGGRGGDGGGGLVVMIAW